MGVDNLFKARKPRKHFRGGGYDAGNDGATASGYGGSGETTGDSSNDNTGPGGTSNFGGGNFYFFIYFNSRR